MVDNIAILLERVVRAAFPQFHNSKPDSVAAFRHQCREDALRIAHGVFFAMDEERAFCTGLLMQVSSSAWSAWAEKPLMV